MAARRAAPLRQRFAGFRMDGLDFGEARFDLVLTFRKLHNFDADTRAAMNAAAFRAPTPRRPVRSHRPHAAPHGEHGSVHAAVSAAVGRARPPDKGWQSVHGGLADYQAFGKGVPSGCAVGRRQGSHFSGHDCVVECEELEPQLARDLGPRFPPMT